MRALATPFTFLPSHSQLEPERCAKLLQRLSSLISLGIFFLVGSLPFSAVQGPQVKDEGIVRLVLLTAGSF